MISDSIHFFLIWMVPICSTIPRVAPRFSQQKFRKIPQKMGKKTKNSPKMGEKTDHPGPASRRTGAVRRKDPGRGEEGGGGPRGHGEWENAGENMWKCHGTHGNTITKIWDSHRFLMISRGKSWKRECFLISECKFPSFWWCLEGNYW